ncbi:hypothetical protein AMTRI_Chr09g23090 [Amborella trichopoda]
MELPRPIRHSNWGATLFPHNIKGIEKWNREVWVVPDLTYLKNFFSLSHPKSAVIVPCRDTILCLMGHLLPFLPRIRTGSRSANNLVPGHQHPHAGVAHRHFQKNWGLLRCI